ncbi:flagellar biosynthesis regulator FlaF [Parvularcula lutaonensis]|uniref:Flagellar biosynthesis regulator FlaF n=1 Tax=Parvularcula lutaonensis TaxID=491923 RepID=A0ABV7MA61_9PROT|nr:flagellar biosynthesis regulator FlaF [Parvularcula lutaonensis]GGY43881.1 hypothetical protein GCM10007148_10880 [Parvularcula lutaonensis]
MEYGVVQRETASGRDLEREVLERVTTRMRAADPSDVAGLAQLHEALQRNRAIWMTFASDLANPNNLCSNDLKASMISIAGFVERNTQAASKNPDVLRSLIEINESIIAGLRHSAPPRSPASPSRELLGA